MKEWENKTGDFYKDLAMRESNNKIIAQNPDTHYVCLYQMGKKALVDAGYYQQGPRTGREKFLKARKYSINYVM